MTESKTAVVSRTVWREVEVVRGGAQRLVAITSTPQMRQHHDAPRHQLL
jgi:hypothetical protein